MEYAFPPMNCIKEMLWLPFNEIPEGTLGMIIKCPPLETFKNLQFVEHRLPLPFKEVPERTLAIRREVEYGKREENSQEKRSTR